MDENQPNLNFLKENISNIYEYLYLNSLDSKMINSLNLFMDAYNQTLNEYLNANNPSYDLIQKLKILSGPINFVYANFPDNPNSLEPHPAADLIKKKINDYNTELENTRLENAGLEKGFTRVKKNANMPSTIPDENEYTQINGFTTGAIIVILTILFGILLGTLLFFIK